MLPRRSKRPHGLTWAARDPVEWRAHDAGGGGALERARADGRETASTKEDFFAGTNKNCRYDHFNMGGGKIDAVMKCTEEGMAQTMTMAGTYSPDTYQMTMAMKSEGGAAAASGMSMKMRVDAKRVAKGRGSRDPVAPAAVAEAGISLADHAQRDLGPIAEERVAQGAPIWGHHAHDVAGLGVHRGDVAAIDPRMTGPNPILTAPGDDC